MDQSAKQNLGVTNRQHVGSEEPMEMSVFGTKSVSRKCIQQEM